MADAIKGVYNNASLQELALDIQSVYHAFQTSAFLNAIMDETWETLELKDRIMQISINLRKYLPSDYQTAIGIIDQIAMNYGTWLNGFAAFFPTFVELYGQDEENWDISMAALARYTQYASSEFAVRAFIIRYEERMMEQMNAWAKDESEHVRRLASEGCRPALPWGKALNRFKKDPAPILPILEQLKTDPSMHVRKSVANNLNDISKTHPDLVIALAKKWYGKHENTNWIVKHGCRTLLKQGNREALALFGYDDIDSVDIKDFALETTSIRIGDKITFSFAILAKKETKIRLEYGIDYMKSKGKRNRKIFKISEILLKEGQEKLYTKKHSFADVSVRKHYPGMHSITLIVNGMEYKTLDFELQA